jgi:predicted DNA-binding helix-hairpin-helix protein
MGKLFLMTASITGCLQSMQPMPALVQPVARPAAHFVVGIDLVPFPHRALARVPGVGATHARRIGRHGAQFLRHRLRRFA